MPIKNCLNLSAADIKSSLMEVSEVLLIKDILNIANNPDIEKKSECEELCKNSILEQFNLFNLFVLKQEFDKINNADRFNKGYDTNGRFNSIKKDFANHVANFDSMVTNGGGADLVALDNKYNNGNNGSSNGSGSNSGNGNGSSNGSGRNGSLDGNPKYSKGYLFPNGLSDSEKARILAMMAASDYYSKNFTGSRLLDKYATSSMIISGKKADGSDYDDDGIFNDDGNPSYVKKISMEEIDNIDLGRKVFKCFKKEFDTNNYIIESKLIRPPVITSNKILNLKRLHDEILTPIFNYYYGDLPASICGMKIVNGLLSEQGVYSLAAGSIVSKHITGEAVDFVMSSIDPDVLIRDIKDKKINIQFGVLTQSNGVHITLPYVFNGYEIKNMIIDSPKRSSDFIDIDFL